MSSLLCLNSDRQLHRLILIRPSPRLPRAIPEEAARHAGLRRRVSPHRLRHSYATRLLRHGAPLVALKALLGHASLVSTEVYLAVDTGDLARMLQQSHPREPGAMQVQ